ncbi:signal peptidase II [Tuwongella immobilis]|uniref:Lipoprotein signal peptidase n=1 Tax=Tuwongella immobilis TaxID=692036 RepID=A0A6C2YJF5_9BACT|nr:signal peptidase II [Tuwongella immobilis]VIP01546.1 lipoprotein signal peptidase : Lipoprotein signal peptidase OS=Pirellula staleyi (strain ATCC 27377 / DSM 6068 / ICPB 4128) GN=lspA PE=3 SV=1: Peptidase_A8 [Tuwongella immobilis]VTR98730.1 lipoprotein signal peptidase : Lipoprotein signal peptidase OS=Pirellula staleyi (strain ATCC 27377 / DSM 6068 / ICPB 4128) GN=lspA PE=3 SV=1: Peptidase_A8 [Tuwongella immobilis]
MKQRSFRWLLLSLAIVGFVGDQASKYGVFRWLYNDGFGDAREVVPGWFRLLAQFDPTRPASTCPLVTWGGEIPPRVNYGALFGLGGEHQGLANGFFAVVSALAAVAILIWGLRATTARDGWLSAALGLILGGTLGNFYDRVVFQGVRDFLHFYYIDWPVFNIADCCLVVGAIMLLIQAFFMAEPEAQPRVAATPADAATSAAPAPTDVPK